MFIAHTLSNGNGIILQPLKKPHTIPGAKKIVTSKVKKNSYMFVLGNLHKLLKLL